MRFFSLVLVVFCACGSSEHGPTRDKVPVIEKRAGDDRNVEACDTADDFEMHDEEKQSATTRPTSISVSVAIARRVDLDVDVLATEDTSFSSFVSLEKLAGTTWQRIQKLNFSPRCENTCIEVGTGAVLELRSNADCNSKLEKFDFSTGEYRLTFAHCDGRPATSYRF